MEAKRIKNVTEFKTAVLEYFAQGLSVEQITILVNKRGAIASQVAIETVLNSVKKN